MNKLKETLITTAFVAGVATAVIGLPVGGAIYMDQTVGAKMRAEREAKGLKPNEVMFEGQPTDFFGVGRIKIMREVAKKNNIGERELVECIETKPHYKTMKELFAKDGREYRPYSLAYRVCDVFGGCHVNNELRQYAHECGLDEKKKQKAIINAERFAKGERERGI